MDSLVSSSKQPGYVGFEGKHTSGSLKLLANPLRPSSAMFTNVNTIPISLIITGAGFPLVLDSKVG